MFTIETRYARQAPGNHLKRNTHPSDNLGSLCLVSTTLESSMLCNSWQWINCPGIEIGALPALLSISPNWVHINKRSLVPCSKLETLFLVSRMLCSYSSIRWTFPQESILQVKNMSSVYWFCYNQNWACLAVKRNGKSCHDEVGMCQEVPFI